MYMTGTPISMLTAYDYHSARYLEQAGIDICLVGDSLAMVACGYASTNEIGMDEMLYHCRAVARGAKTPFLIGDMPFGSHQASLETGVTNAIRMIREGGMEAVKIEGGKDVLPLVTRLVDIGIPVMGHIGLMPQRQSALSGFRVQGKTAESALQITKDALALQEAGAFAVLIEALPSRVAESLVSDLRIPTIGIGASSACAGQVLVQTDMLGMTEKVPRFCKKYADLATAVPDALRAYHEEVKSRSFPEESTNTYDMPEEEWRRFSELRAELKQQR
ncbi:ketopantoate hydroxymethyltransferase [Cystobasidium minutum MCA 4210]|uniref:ketopantoate hydroxymethyltransferase n=1 Tax=Cystobasidium minutum MCA 4210 TaxID=1397322 RepID=UPI0034CE0D57|eukprot:jgi/Rhomi1/179224/fgenesh1_pg.3_\